MRAITTDRRRIRLLRFVYEDVSFEWICDVIFSIAPYFLGFRALTGGVPPACRTCVLTTHPFYLMPGMENQSQMNDYLSDDEEGRALRNPQTPAPDWSRGGTFEHPLSESDGEAEESAPAAPTCAVCFSASHRPLVYTKRVPRRTFGVVSYDGGLRSARSRFAIGF